MGKVWVISEYYYPIVTSTGYYMTEIAEYLAKRGCEVHVITTGAKYNEVENYQTSKKEVHNGVFIERFLSKEIDKNNFFKRVVRLTFSSLGLFFLILRKVKKGDKILLVTNPAFLVLLMPIVSILKKVRYKLLVHDVFPENLIAIGKTKSSSVGYKCMKWIFDTAYRRAELCISIGRDMTQIIKQKIKKNTVVMIPNWADNTVVWPQKKEETTLYKGLGIDKFVFMFAGNLGYVQGIDNILDTIDLIDNKNIMFLFIGGGAKADEVKKYADMHENVVYMEFQDRSNQNDFLNACDVAIVTLGEGMYGLGVPSKSYNIMASGTPMLYIGDKISEIALCIDEYHIGWVVEPHNPQMLKKQIEKIYAQRNNFETMKQNARNAADKVFAKNIILEEYFKLFQV